MHSTGSSCILRLCVLAAAGGRSCAHAAAQISSLTAAAAAAAAVIAPALPARYEGPNSTNPLAFRYYNADELILGKPMKEW